jgi:thiamine biosynthesis lipoprotein
MKSLFSKRVMFFPPGPAMLLALGMMTLIAGGCDKQPDQTSSTLIKVDSPKMLIMGTFAQIQLRCLDQQTGRQAIAAARQTLDEIDQMLSTYREDSELSQVNLRAAEGPVKVSHETYYVLKKAYEYSQITDGAFDITVTPLLSVWKQAGGEDRLPSQEELDQAKKKVGFGNLQLSEPQKSTVSFYQPGVRLNVDAIAKGYAVDRALAALRLPGVAAGLVDIGGEIACFTQDDVTQDWLVGIQNPFAWDTDNPLSQQARWVVRLRNGAIATSGNYRRYTTIKHKKYSHIIDPRTGQPAQELPSVTIIALQTIDADALATAVSVMGPEKGLQLIESIDDTEAFLVTGSDEKPQTYRSSGFAKYEVEDNAKQ